MSPGHTPSPPPLEAITGSFVRMTIPSEVAVHQISFEHRVVTSVRLQEGPIDLQSLTMWYAVWGSPQWHRLSLPNPHFTIEPPNFPIPVRNLFSWTQAITGATSSIYCQWACSHKIS